MQLLFNFLEAILPLQLQKYETNKFTLYLGVHSKSTPPAPTLTIYNLIQISNFSGSGNSCEHRFKSHSIMHREEG
jgi:hypothetical protein